MIISPRVYSVISTADCGASIVGVFGSSDRDFNTRRIQTDKNNIINTKNAFKRLKSIMVILLIYPAFAVGPNAGIQFEYHNVHLIIPTEFQSHQKQPLLH